MPTTALAIGHRRRPATGSRCRRLGALLAALLGACQHRSVAELSGSLPIEQDVRTVRFELQNGTVGIDGHAERAVAYAGGVRRAADSAAELTVLEAIPLALTAARDPADASVLVVRGPALTTAHPRGILGLELGLRVPADVAVEVRIEGSGHVTVANRAAPLAVHTGRGDLRFEYCAGPITARTGRGNVIAIDHRGDLDIRAATGDMQVFVREPASRIRLDTGKGTIQCYVPPTAGCRVDARAQVGRCGSSLGLQTEKVGDWGAAMTGTRGDGRTEIVLRTGTGHLSLGSKTYE